MADIEIVALSIYQEAPGIDSEIVFS